MDYLRLFQEMVVSPCGFQGRLCAAVFFIFFVFLNGVWTRKGVESEWERGRECIKPPQDVPSVSSSPGSIGIFQLLPRAASLNSQPKNSSLFLPLVFLLWSINLGINLKLAEQCFGRDEM